MSKRSARLRRNRDAHVDGGGSTPAHSGGEGYIMQLRLLPQTIVTLRRPFLCCPGPSPTCRCLSVAGRLSSSNEGLPQAATWFSAWRIGNNLAHLVFRDGPTRRLSCQWAMGGNVVPDNTMGPDPRRSRTALTRTGRFLPVEIYRLTRGWRRIVEEPSVPRPTRCGDCEVSFFEEAMSELCITA